MSLDETSPPVAIGLLIMMYPVIRDEIDRRVRALLAELVPAKGHVRAGGPTRP